VELHRKLAAGATPPSQEAAEVHTRHGGAAGWRLEGDLGSPVAAGVTPPPALADAKAKTGETVGQGT
jgi:hypothetical protein